MDNFTLDELLLIENTMTIFYESTSIPSILIDSEGREVLYSNKKESYCHYFRKVDKEGDVCCKSHHRSGLQSKKIGETYISFCPAELVYFTSAITIGGEYKGAIISGPILFDLPDMYLQRNTLLARGLELGEIGFLELYYQRIQVLSTERGRRLSELLNILLNQLKDQLGGEETVIETLYLEDPLEKHEVKLNTNEVYPVKIEKELLHYIKNTNKIGARKALNELLGYIYLRCDISHQEILVMVLQVIVLMSRAAIDAGIEYSKMSVLINNYVLQIKENESSEESYVLVKELLDELMNCIFAKNDKKNNEKAVVQKITSYIQNNYNTGLTLEEVASYVNMNATYLSRFIKKHLGINFSEYVNTIRVEFSKEYLENEKYSIIDVALMMGFTDQAYYSKVFKKYTNMTPGKYRKNHKVG